MSIMWFIVVAIITVIYLSGGLILKKTATSKPNALIGYRTRRSSASCQAWNYANSLAGKLLFGVGTFTLLVGLLMLVLLRNSSEQQATTWVIVHTYLSVILLFVIIIITELNLRKKYDKNGKEK